MARRRRPPRAGAVTELPPLRILTQILAMQTCFYGWLAVLAAFACVAGGWEFGWRLVFGWDGVRGDTTRGWVMGFVLCFVGAFMCGLIGMVVIVGRSKLVLDFALTMHGLHLVVTYLYTGETPRNQAWWVVMGISSLGAVVLGVYGCRWRELQPVFFSSSGGRSKAGGNDMNGSIGGDVEERGILASDERIEDMERGLQRGKNWKGKGRDVGREYEMVQISQERRDD